MMEYLFKTSAETEIILASASPRRSEILSSMGIEFQIVPSGVDEESIKGPPEVLVERLSLLKAEDVSRSYPNHWIVGGDTVVVVNNEILGKPSDREHARVMLQKLSGTTHSVFGGVTLMHREDGVQKSFVCESEVTFIDLSDECIQRYISSDECFDKAGSYAIQGQGQFFVEQIVGSYTNIVGIDAQKTALLLLEQGAIEWRR